MAFDDGKTNEIRRLMDCLLLAPVQKADKTSGAACPFRPDEPAESLPRAEVERFSKTFSGGCFVLPFDSRRKAR